MGKTGGNAAVPLISTSAIWQVDLLIEQMLVRQSGCSDVSKLTCRSMVQAAHRRCRLQQVAGNA